MTTIALSIVPNISEGVCAINIVNGKAYVIGDGFVNCGTVDSPPECNTIIWLNNDNQLPKFYTSGSEITVQITSSCCQYTFLQFQTTQDTPMGIIGFAPKNLFPNKSALIERIKKIKINRKPPRK